LKGSNIGAILMVLLASLVYILANYKADLYCRIGVKGEGIPF
jgi:hypothetical protein